MKLFIPFFLYTNAIFSQAWIQLPDFPSSKRDDGVAVTVNNKAYFGTGLEEWSATGDFFALDFSNYSWSVISPMPLYSERQYACVFSGTKCFYVFGGDGGFGALNSLYKYDVVLNTWILVSPKPGNGLVGAMSMNFGDKIIICGGKFQSGKTSDQVWEYSLSNDTWQQKNNVPFSGRWRASATVLNNNGYLLFGLDSSGSYRKDFYSYNPASDQWTKIMDFPLSQGRAYASLNVVNSKLVLFGGLDSLGTYYKDLWFYDMNSTTWLKGPDLPSNGRKGGMSCSYGESIFYSCGIKAGDQRLNETWMTQIPLGLKENKYQENFSVYPNPVSDSFYLQFSSSFENTPQLFIQLTDVLGRVVYSQSVLNSERKITIDFLPPGIYLISIYLGTELKGLKKIIKE